MQYFGGKAKIAKPLAEYLNSQLKDGQPFVDLFCGSCNVISKIDASRPRVANDLHYELIELHKAVQGGWVIPDAVSEDDYKRMRHNTTDYPPELRGFAGFGCAFSGDWFKGYAKDGNGRDYCMNAKNSLLKKHTTLKNVKFINASYNEVSLPRHSLVYCDIPYKDTTKYSTGHFCHTSFYEWAAKTQADGHTVLVSEYKHNLPEGWEIVWEHRSKKDIRNSKGVQQETIEILMRPKQLKEINGN